MSQITIADRVDAVIEAVRISDDLYRKLSVDAQKFDGPALSIALQLRQSSVDVGAIKQSIAALLANKAGLTGHDLAFIRMRLGRIEHYLGIPHGAETKAALAAWESGETNNDQWGPFCASLESESEAA